MKGTAVSKTRHPGIYRIVWTTGRVTWQARAPWWIDAEGKRHTPTKNFDSLADAKAWRAEKIAERSRGVRTPSGRLTLGEYLTDWIERYRARNPGNTSATYARGLSKLQATRIWGIRIGKVDRQAIERAYDELNPRAVAHAHDALHRALADAIPGLLASNPATGAARGRSAPRTERSVWTEDEYRAFLAVAQGEWLWPLWRTIAQTGLRRGEALGLDWSDVDLDRGTLTIRRQFTVIGGRCTIKDVKTPRARRTVDLDPETVLVLREWRKRQPRTLNPDAASKHAVFTYPDGARVGPTRSLNDHFHRIIATAGLRRLTIHDLRHTHATLLLQRGVPIHVVSRRLGHASEAITLTTYAHVLPDQARMAAEAASAIAGDAARSVTA